MFRILLLYEKRKVRTKPLQLLVGAVAFSTPSTLAGKKVPINATTCDRLLRTYNA